MNLADHALKLVTSAGLHKRGAYKNPRTGVKETLIDNKEKMLQWISQGLPASKICKGLDVSPTSFWSYINDILTKESVDQLRINAKTTQGKSK